MQAERRAHFTGHQGSVYALCKLNEDEFLSGSGDHHLVKWNVNNEKEGTVWATFPSGIYSLLYLKNNLLLAGTGNGEIHQVSFSEQKQQVVVNHHAQTVFALQCVDSKGLILACGGDGLFTVSDMETLQLIKSFSFGNFKVRCVLTDENNNICYIGCGDGKVYILNLHSLTIVHQFHAHAEGFSVNALAVSPDGQFLYTASRDARMNVFDVKNNYFKTDSVPAHNYAIYGIKYSPSNKIMATVSRDKTAKLWNGGPMDFGLRLDKEKMNGHTHSVNTLEWLNDTTLLTAGDDRSIIAWTIS